MASPPLHSKRTGTDSRLVLAICATLTALAVAGLSRSESIRPEGATESSRDWRAACAVTTSNAFVCALTSASEGRSCLAAYDAKNGAELWRQVTNGLASCSAWDKEGAAVVFVIGDQVTKHSLLSGARIWTATLPAARQPMPGRDEMDSLRNQERDVLDRLRSAADPHSMAMRELRLQLEELREKIARRKQEDDLVREGTLTTRVQYPRAIVAGSTVMIFRRAWFTLGADVGRGSLSEWFAFGRLRGEAVASDRGRWAGSLGELIFYGREHDSGLWWFKGGATGDVSHLVVSTERKAQVFIGEGIENCISQEQCLVGTVRTDEGRRGSLVYRLTSGSVAVIPGTDDPDEIGQWFVLGEKVFRLSQRPNSDQGEGLSCWVDVYGPNGATTLNRRLDELGTQNLQGMVTFELLDEVNGRAVVALYATQTGGGEARGVRDGELLSIGLSDGSVERIVLKGASMTGARGRFFGSAGAGYVVQPVSGKHAASGAPLSNGVLLCAFDLLSGVEVWRAVVHEFEP